MRSRRKVIRLVIDSDLSPSERVLVVGIEAKSGRQLLVVKVLAEVEGVLVRIPIEPFYRLLLRRCSTVWHLDKSVYYVTNS